MSRRIIHMALSLTAVLWLASCSVYKYVPEGQHLLNKIPPARASFSAEFHLSVKVGARRMQKDSRPSVINKRKFGVTHHADNIGLIRSITV